mgnify:CR=1 FL=1
MSDGTLQEQVVIQCSQSGNRIILSARQENTWEHGEESSVSALVTIEAGGLRAFTEVDFFYSNDTFVSFFEELARNWKGWDGERSVSSLECDFKLCATSDRLGHGTLRVSLHSGGYDGVSCGWRAEAELRLDAWQYAVIAKEMRLFLGAVQSR